MESKAKILYITVNDPNDQQIRNGVPYSIYKQLEKYYDVLWMRPQVKGIKAGCYEIIGKIFEFLVRRFRYTSIHNPLRAKARSYYIQKQLDKNDYDAIFALSTVDFAYLQTCKPIFYRNDAIVQSMIDYYYWNVPCFIRKWACEMENRALKKVQMFFTPSQWVIDEINKWNVPISKCNIQLIESGANLAEEKVLYPQRVYGKDIPINMIFVGYDVKRKGIDVAYDTLCLLNKKYQVETTLTIIGGKPDSRMLQDPQVRYIGILNKNILDDYKLFYDEFAKSNLFIFPTKAECHGIVNCEAAAYALPIFSYNTGGVSTYVRSGVNGEVLPLTAIGADFARVIYQALVGGILPNYSNASRKLYENRFNWNIWGKKVKESIDSTIS